MEYRDDDYESTTTTDQPIEDLFKDLRDETATLVRQQVELAKTEMSEKVSKYIRNTIYLAVGGLVAYAGFLYLLLAGSNAIAVGLAAAGLGSSVFSWLAPLILGIVVAVVGYLFVQKAINTMKRASIMPEKTVHSIKEDGKWLRKK